MRAGSRSTSSRSYKTTIFEIGSLLMLANLTNLDEFKRNTFETDFQEIWNKSPELVLMKAKKKKGTNSIRLWNETMFSTRVIRRTMFFTIFFFNNLVY